MFQTTNQGLLDISEAVHWSFKNPTMTIRHDSFNREIAKWVGKARCHDAVRARLCWWNFANSLALKLEITARSCKSFPRVAWERSTLEHGSSDVRDGISYYLRCIVCKSMSIYIYIYYLYYISILLSIIYLLYISILYLFY